MQNTNNIEFRKKRDFGEKLNASFEYIRQEFKPLMTAIIYIAGPSIAVVAIVQAYFQRYSLSFFNFTFEDPTEFFADDLWGTMTTLVIFSLAAQFFLFATINEYIKQYIRSSNSSITVGNLWTALKSVLGRYAISILFYFIVVVFFAIAAALVMALFASSDSVFLIIIGFIVLIMAAFMLMSLLYFGPVVYNVEDKGLFDSVGRSIELIRGKWLSTIGLLFISSIVASVASFVFALPNAVLTSLEAFHAVDGSEAGDTSFAETVVFGLTSVISTIGSYFLSAIPIIAMIFQYHNLVERTDASGLLNRIDQIGSHDTEDPDESY